MVVLEHLSDESAFKTAMRGGRQSRAQRVQEERLNEALRLRASYETVASQGKVRWDAAEFAWLDPVDQRERDEKLISEVEELSGAEEEIWSDFGFT